METKMETTGIIGIIGFYTVQKILEYVYIDFCGRKT